LIGEKRSYKLIHIKKISLQNHLLKKHPFKKFFYTKLRCKQAMRKLFLLSVLFLFGMMFIASAQNTQSKTCTITGFVTDAQNNPLQEVNVYDTLNYKGTSTDSKGFFKIELPKQKKAVVAFRYVGFETVYKSVNTFNKNKLKLEVQLKPSTLNEITIRDEITRGTSIERINSQALEVISSAGSGVENIVKSLPGVSSNNELSSQYSVRGGNFDENLVYVNGFEITRPFLIRSGQQEGLSFINPDLVGSIKFSSGGFQAKYGDKMSSVLDIAYKTPTEFKGSIGIGLLGYSGHIEGISNNKKITFLLGVRFKSNAYLLNALPTQGDYQPSFLDIQTNLAYQINSNLKLAYIGNFSRNKYEIIPQFSESSFGAVNFSRQIRIAFDGQERDSFLSTMNGLSLSYQPNTKFSAKLLSSVYATLEKESFDIISEYYIGEVETDASKEDYGKVTTILGVGTFHDYARNRLAAVISNTELNATYEVNKNHYLQAGLQFKYENIQDQLKEWDRVDSAGYSRPVSIDEVLLSRYLKAEANISGNRFAGFLQDTYTAGINNRFKVTAGLRFNYWSFNKELYLNPRLQASFTPTGLFIGNKEIKRDVLLRFSTGAHYQPPFYREMRNYEGVINSSLRSQKSWHTVLGAEYQFKISNKPFKFMVEAYHKKLWDLVPYDIDNVLIRYTGLNEATGYAVGIDFRLNGQFVGDTESWFSFSLLKTEEDLANDSFIYEFEDEVTGEPMQIDSLVGSVARPTDQRYNFNIFFQDHIPNNENYKVHLNFVMGGGLAYGPPNNARYRNAFRFNSYKRADIGFSALLFDTKKRDLPSKNPLRHFNSFWLTAEILNILGFENTLSAIWVEDFNGVQYAAPNRLTSRLVNVRLVSKF